MLVDNTVIGIVNSLFAFDSFTFTLVVPDATGVTVSVLPLRLAVAIDVFGVAGDVVTKLNVPTFVPPSATVLFAPPTYAVTLVGFAVIFPTAITVMFIVFV